MRRMIGLAAAGALIAGSAATAMADEGGPNLTFAASTSYTFDFNDPDTQSTGQNPRTYASAEQDESFNIDLVQIGASGTRGPVSYGAKIDMGDWASFVGDSLDGDIALQELFLAIDAGWATVTAGRIPTPIGYEVLEPWANANISRSQAWWIQPISHDGLAVSGEAGDASWMVGLVNGLFVNDFAGNNIDDEYGVLASVGIPIGDADLRFAGIYSEEADATNNYELNGLLAGVYNNCRYGLESTYLYSHLKNNTLGPDNTTVWDVTAYGGATWGQVSLDLRGSYTDQDAGVSSFGDNEIFSFTTTGGYEITDGVVVRAEYRVDISDENIFNDDDSISGSPDDLINVLQFQLLWTPATGEE